MNFKILFVLFTSIKLSVAALSLIISPLSVVNNRAFDGLYIPLWMKPKTIIIYYEDPNYTIIYGGELSEADIVGRDDIASIGLTTTDPGFRAVPYTRIEYDRHGFHKNTYHLYPGTLGLFQLSPPRMKGTGTGFYGVYHNSDTNTDQHNVIRLNVPSYVISGTGRITYYHSSTDNQDITHAKYDCTAKMYVCDVPSSTLITAMNIHVGKTQVLYKRDCKNLSDSILEVWNGTDGNDASNQVIRNITSSGDLDNVYSGHVTMAGN